MTAAVMTTVLFLIVTPCSVVDVHQCRRGSCHLKDKDKFKSRHSKTYTDWGLGVEKCKAIFRPFKSLLITTFLKSYLPFYERIQRQIAVFLEKKSFFPL
jgi:hypothetical protein